MPGRRAQLIHWFDSGAISPDRADEAMAACGIAPDPARWLRFLDVTLLLLGGLALASGVVFFVAFNWDGLGRFGKFALVQFLFAAAFVAWWRLGVDRLAARVSLLVAATLLGALLALYGQIYQTGADPWQLFASWALLMLPWALVGRFAPLWLLWLLLLNLAAALWYDARFGWLGAAFASKDDLLWLLFLLDGSTWIVWEVVARHHAWLELGRWPVRLIACATGAALTVLVLRSVFDADSPPIVLAWGVFLAWLAAVHSVYRRRFPDLFMLAGGWLALIVCVTAALAKWVLNGDDAAGALLLLAFAVVSQAAAAAVWLKKVHAELAS